MLFFFFIVGPGIPALRKQSNFLWVQGQPGLHNEFQSSQELYNYSSTNPRQMNTDPCVCSQLLKQTRAEGPWPLSNLVMPGSLLTMEALLTLFYPLCSFMSHPGWWFPHLTITELCVFIISKSLIPSTSSDTNPYIYDSSFLMYVHMCLYGVCVGVCACACAQVHAWSSKADVRNHPQLHFIQGLSQKKKIQSLANMAYLASQHALETSCLCLLRVISHTRPFIWFLGIPSKHWNP